MPHRRISSRHPVDSPDLENSGDNYYMSLSDLMVGMLFIFLILVTYFALQSRTYERENQWLKKLEISGASDRDLLIEASRQNDRLQQDLRQLESSLTNTDRLRSDLLRRIQTELTRRGVRSEISEEQGVLRLPQDTLFDPGSATLRPRGSEAVQQVGTVLHALLSDPALSSRLESIFIEGHTDNTPILNSQFRDNLNLSAARAMNTYQALIRGSGLSSATNPRQQALFGISGYGDLRPIGDNQTDAGRERNRRIDFRFVLSAPASAQSPAPFPLPPPPTSDEPSQVHP